MAGRVYTDPAKFAAALRRFAEREKDKPIIAGMRRGLHHARNLAGEEFRKRGVGRGIFGGNRRKDKAAVRLIINRLRVRKVGSNFTSGLDLRGLAALQEKGGQTEPHVIKPRLAPKLIFPVSGRIVITDQVNHPGSRIPAFPVADRAVERALPRIREEVDRGLQESIKKVIG